jgi:aarF domain-containing kinase
MRTPDGRLAILDFGLMTQVPEDTSLALVEYIAHLSVSDWPAVAEDLVKLGFIPADAPSPRTSGLAEPLGRILEQLVAGGGAAKVNIEGVLAELDSLGRTFPYFQVPPYFALILRCFSVIEGIALRVDPDYAIVKECWPYIARRLLTDDHPRAKEALRQLLFGEGEHIDVARLERLVQGVGNFTVAGLDPAGPQRQRSASASEPAEQAPVLNDTAKQALLVLFSRTGSPAQELLVGEAAAYVDAGVRQLASQLIGQLLGSAPAVLSATATQALGPWRPLLLPFPTPVEQLGWLAPVMQPSESDRKVLDSASGIARAVGANVSAPRLDAQGLAQAGRLGAELLPLLPELLPGVGKIASVFSAKLISRTRQRLEAPADAGYSAPMDL